MSSVFDKSIECAWQITKQFNETGEAVEVYQDDRLGINDIVFSSDRYRRAHISIVDARETKKVWMLHATVFPHYNDPSPIYGFDIVAGPSKVSGAFHDFSCGGELDHNMMLWFETTAHNIDWNKKRELPDWAKHIFSNSMIAIGAVGPEELDKFVDIGLTTLDYYLSKVGNTQESLSDYHMAQNKYCRYQKQNPHTPRVLANLGFTDTEIKEFIGTHMFPEIN